MIIVPTITIGKKNNEFTFGRGDFSVKLNKISKAQKIEEWKKITCQKVWIQTCGRNCWWITWREWRRRILSSGTKNCSTRSRSTVVREWRWSKSSKLIQWSVYAWLENSIKFKVNKKKTQFQLLCTFWVSLTCRWTQPLDHSQCHSYRFAWISLSLIRDASWVPIRCDSKKILACCCADPNRCRCTCDERGVVEPRSQ